MRDNIKYFLLPLFIVLLFFPVLKGCSKSSQQGDPPVKFKDSVTVTAGEKYKRNFLHNFLFGNHYRDLWATEVKFPVIDLTKIKGGLTPLKKGGGQQTTSIHLIDSSGRRFVLRSVDKDPSDLLPKILQATYISFILADQTSAGNPYAALIVDDLSKIAGIYHTNPQYFVVPYSDLLDEYTQKLQGKIAMFEEKPNATWSGSPVFCNPANINDTEEMLDVRLNKQNAFIDQKQFLRSRLFDMWINDWDRHSDQWEWMRFNIGDSIVFQPLPRDRDNAFYMFDDGVVPFIASRWWGNPKFQSFHSYYESVEGLMINSIYVDNLFLNRLDKKEWCEVTADLRKVLTDSAIIHAVKQWPREVFEEEGEETIETLIARRNRLDDASMKFYDLLNEEVAIAGTDERELVTIERKPDSTFIKMESLSTDLVMYQRTIPNDLTKSICIYTLKGNDRIIIKGEVKDGARLNIYPGEDNDYVKDESVVKGFTRKTRIYDSKEGNEFFFGTEAKDKTSKDPDIMEFNRTGERKK